MATSQNREQFGVHERMLVQQAEQTIKNDPVLALVELVTNSDDGYRRMAKSSKAVSGNIFIQVAPRRKSDATVYCVYDNGPGMDDKEMMKKVKLMGGDESELTKKTGGRSFFGRGLKECMIAFGKAEIRSVKNGMHYQCTSYRVQIDKIPETRKATHQDYKELQIPEGSSGTRVRLFAVNDKISSTPQFQTFAKSLSFHYSLRDIVSSSNRNVVLRYGNLDYRGNWSIKNEQKLSYSPPEGELILDKKIVPDGYKDVEIRIEAYRAHKEIPEPAERYEERRGFLICSKNAINDVYHFGFNNHEAAGLIFGRVTCYYFDHLLRVEQDAQWINASRDGIRWSHSFCRTLNKAVGKELRPLFQQEKEKYSEAKKKYEDEETEKRVTEALDFINKIASEELDDLGGSISGDEEKPGEDDDKVIIDKDKEPKKITRVPNGFAFIPPFVRMNITKPRTITIRVELLGDVTEKSSISLQSSNPGIKIENSLLHITDFMKDKKILSDPEGGQQITIVTMRTKISCDEVGAEGKILAVCESKEATLEVFVTEEQKTGGGLFSGHEFDSEAPPEQRVQYIRGSGIVKIATSAPSFIKYFGPNGETQGTPEAKSLLAELILDTCCSELVRLRFSQEGFFIPDSDPSSMSELLQFEISQYKNKLADRIHKIIFGR